MEILEEISKQLQTGNDEPIPQLIRSAIANNINPKAILDNGLIAGMNVIGKQFRDHEIFLPDVLLAAKAMYAGLDELKPYFIKEGIPSHGKVVIGTVKGDLHDLGKNLVGIMLKGRKTYRDVRTARSAWTPAAATNPSSRPREPAAR